MKLSTIRAQTAPLALPVGGETLTVEYRPGAYTWTYLVEQATRPLSESLPELLAGWDLTDDAGEPLAITPEVLASLPLPLLRQIQDGIQESLFPNPARSEDSGSFS